MTEVWAMSPEEEVLQLRASRIRQEDDWAGPKCRDVADEILGSLQNAASDSKDSR